MTGNEEAWKRDIEKLLTEMVEMRNEVRRDIKNLTDQLAEERKARVEERRREKRGMVTEEKRILEKRIRNLE